MPRGTKRKRGVENNAGFYQDSVDLSTQGLLRSQLGAWLQGVIRTSPPHVWLLSGELGAGKTTLVQALGQVLGVTSDITSPTFSLQKIHPLRGQPWERLVHLDAYRLKALTEIAALELPEYIADLSSLVVVEWPERLSGVSWGSHLHFRLTKTSRQDRRDVVVTFED